MNGFRLLQLHQAKRRAKHRLEVSFFAGVPSVRTVHGMRRGAVEIISHVIEVATQKGPAELVERKSSLTLRRREAVVVIDCMLPASREGSHQAQGPRRTA